MDLPCYTCPAVQDDFRKRIRKSCTKKRKSSNKSIEIVKILVPLIDAPDLHFWNTLIHLAACFGQSEVLKSLIPLTDNPNAPDNDGRTPIHWAAFYGHTKIVKIFVPLTDDPNAPDKDGRTPISWAESNWGTGIVPESNWGTEIVQILAPFTGTK